MFNKETDFVVDTSTGQKCKELRLHLGFDYEDMELRCGYSKEVLKEWEENETAIYPDALRCAYYNAFLMNCTSNEEFALHQIFTEFPLMKKNVVAQQILEEWEVYELLGEDVQEWFGSINQNRDFNKQKLTNGGIYE